MNRTLLRRLKDDIITTENLKLVYHKIELKLAMYGIECQIQE